MAGRSFAGLWCCRCLSWPHWLATAPSVWTPISGSAWVGLLYVSIFSSLVGFVFWYRGLSQGGIAAVSQLQLLQPFLGLILAAVLLKERIAWPMIAAAAVVLFCVVGATRFASAAQDGGRPAS